MKKINIQFIAIMAVTFCPVVKFSLHADASIPLSQPLKGDNENDVQGLINNIPCNPAVIIDDTTHQLTQIPVNRLSRFMLPHDTINMAQKSNLSVFRPTDANVYKNYPSGSALFGKHADAAEQFDITIAAIKANNELIKFFRKIHFNCLNQMYIYFMKIYTNMIVRRVGASRSDKGDLITNLHTFTADDQACATNQKILIMSLLVNLIESQLHAMIMACSPKLPYLFATPAGKILIQNDFGTDLTTFALPQDDEVLQHLQSSYIDFLKKYINFFKTYNNLLLQHDDSTGFTQFATIAESIQTSKIAAQMNPLMFFYNDETMRAIKIIPYLASHLPTKTSSIGWAQDAIDAATKSTMNKGNPVAYFKNNQNEITKDASQASHLFILSMAGDNMVEEELLVQPEWLNSSQGIINMLQACLGDFSHLTTLNILDPFTQAIIEKSTTGSVNTDTIQTVKDFSVALAPTAPEASVPATAIPTTPIAATPVATTISTTFFNDSSLPMTIQPLVNGNKSGNPITIKYAATTPFQSGIVTLEAVSSAVSYKVTIDGKSWPAVTVPYDANKKSYQVNADAVKGLIYVA